jgi:hypothetical protein
VWTADGRGNRPLVVSNNATTLNVLANQSGWLTLQLIPSQTQDLLPSGIQSVGECAAVTFDCRCYRWVTNVDPPFEIVQRTGLKVAGLLPPLAEQTVLRVTSSLAEDLDLSGRYAPPTVVASIGAVTGRHPYAITTATVALLDYCKRAQTSVSGQMVADRMDLSYQQLESTITIGPVTPIITPPNRPGDSLVIAGLLLYSSSLLLYILKVATRFVYVEHGTQERKDQ